MHAFGGGISDMSTTKVCILGSGNIGTDLMFKILRSSEKLEVAAMVGIDAASDGLARARRLGVMATSGGLESILRAREFQDVQIVMDATSAREHKRHNEMLHSRGVCIIDLTPAAIGPYVVPAVNLSENAGVRNVSMVSCGGQATIPIVAAVARVARVHYAEIVASIASNSAGPGTRANIDEFTRTTAHGLECVGGARLGKAIIVLNPAEPPLIMRDTVSCLSDAADPQRIASSIAAVVRDVQAYVPGYRLKQDVQFETIPHDRPLTIPGHAQFSGVRTTVFLEVEGAAHYLPAYAGNLDIMTAAAVRTAERLVEIGVN
jgi:acetaldehyde dehydrogenase